MAPSQIDLPTNLFIDCFNVDTNVITNVRHLVNIYPGKLKIKD